MGGTYKRQVCERVRVSISTLEQDERANQSPFSAVKTYKANGEKNDKSAVDWSKPETVKPFLTDDITAPGGIIIPVCSPQEAFANWGDHPDANTPNFPCN